MVVSVSTSVATETTVVIPLYLTSSQKKRLGDKLYLAVNFRYVWCVSKLSSWRKNVYTYLPSGTATSWPVVPT